MKRNLRMDVKELWCKIKCPIEDFWYNLKYGIENLFNWIPVVWKDRNWDHYFIYVILRHKLHLMEKQIREYGHHVDKDRDANNIKVCVNLLDRLIADDYHEMAFKNHDRKWGESDFQFKECEDNPELMSLHIARENVNTPEDEEKERKDFRRASDHETFLREQDLDLLFKNMRKYIQTWWD